MGGTMTIKVKLLLSSVLAALVVILLSTLLVITSSRIKSSNRNEERATKIVQTVTEIRFVTFEYLLHKNERSFEQWQMKHADLARLLKPLPGERPAERQYLDVIQDNSRDVGSIFNSLVDLQAGSGEYAASSATVKAGLEERFSTQLLIKQQSQISNAVKLADSERLEVIGLGERTDRLIGVTVVMIFSLGLFNFIFITRTISSALASLTKGASRLAGGNFSYRLMSYNSKTEFGRLAAAFNSMAASLEETDKVRSEFILIASHQLRTPLTALKWYTEALLSSDDPLDAETKKEYIRETHASNERMITLVDQLLVASKIGFGSLKTKPEMVDVGPILRNVIQDLSVQSRKKNITVKKTIDSRLPHVWIDPTWLQLILQNLLSNAVKYSPEGQKVAVSVFHRAKSILITVDDHGCGIPEDQKSKIFSRLFRADNARAMEGEGSGLGLYIAKSVIEGAGGKIWFESIENEGTSFYVTLRTTPPARQKETK